MLITESEKEDILIKYGINPEGFTPLQKLLECKFTPDGKYVLFEGKCYSTITGNEVPLNEEWTWSDILHTGADVLSAGLDFVIPGSGAVVDILNAVSYVIEAQFKNAEEKDSLYLMAAITFGFVILPGPLQALATPLKQAVKTGKNFASPIVKKGLTIIGGAIDTLLLNIPTKVNQALKSPLAKNILGKWGKRISGFIDNFTSRIKQLLGSLTKKAGKEGAEKAGKEGAEKAGKKGAEKSGKESGQMTGKSITKSDAFKSKHTVGDAGFPDEWWNLSRDKYKSLVKNQEDLVNKSVNSLVEKTSTLANKTFDPSKVKIISRSNIAKREIMEVQLENGQNVIFYKVTGGGGKTLPPPGAWSVIPGFLDNAFVQGKRVDGWFIKNDATIGLTHKAIDGAGANKYLTEMSQFLQKNGAEGLSKSAQKGGYSVASVMKQLDANPKLLPMSNTPINKNLLPAVVSKSNTLSKLDNAVIGNNGVVVANKLGLVPNSQIKLSNGTKFKMSSDNIIDIEYEMVSSTIKGASKKATRMSAWDFMKTYILKPSAKLSTTTIPLSTKLILRSFGSDGSLNKQELDVLPQLSGVQLQKDLEYLSQSVAEYEGGTGKYTKNTNATTFQNALMKLGYPLPKFGADGKFGPETQVALKKFQQDNNLTSSNGKMDRITARKLAELLKTKNITGTEDLQSTLNKV